MKRFFDKYFEGYEEENVPQISGKKRKTTYRYVGIYYRMDVKKSVQILLRILFVFLFGAAVSLFLFTSSMNLGFNNYPVTIVFQGLTVLSFIWYAYVLLSYIFAERDLKIYSYKSTSPAIIKAGIFTATAFGLDAISVLIFILFFSHTQTRNQMFCFIQYLGCVVLILLISFIENKLPYIKILNSEKGNEI